MKVEECETRPFESFPLHMSRLWVRSVELIQALPASVPGCRGRGDRDADVCEVLTVDTQKTLHEPGRAEHHNSQGRGRLV